MATQTVGQSVTDTVKIWITDLIEADYVARGVFPSIRKALGKSTYDGPKHLYTVTRQEAQAIYEDACEMRSQRRPKSQVGLSIAYGATANRLWQYRSEPAEPEATEALRIASVLELLEEVGKGGTALPVGTRILYFRTDDAYGEHGVIAGEFRHRKVRTERGALSDPDGQRFDFRPGYSIRLDGKDTPFCAPAHKITLDDCKPAHLRLVS